jgi:isopenicillin-N epimerase
MAMVRLPTGALPPTREAALALRDRLLAEHRTDAPLHAHPSGIWLRLSAAAYNEIEDYALLGERCRALLR